MPGAREELTALNLIAELRRGFDRFHPAPVSPGHDLPVGAAEGCDL